MSEAEEKFVANCGNEGENIGVARFGLERLEFERPLGEPVAGRRRQQL